MAAFIEIGTCACVIHALIISVMIGVSTSVHWVNTHEGSGSRAHVYSIFLVYAILHLHHMCETRLILPCIIQTM